MKGLMKLLLGLVALVVVLVVAGGAILATLFNPNDYKPEIVQLAKEKAGVSLQINGEIKWSVFPWLGLELNQIKARFDGQPELASLNQAQLAVRLPALFAGKVEMQSIVIDGLQLNLVQQNPQQNNWTPPQLPTSTAAINPAPQTASTDDSPASVPPLALDIESIQLTNAQVSFEDQQTGQKIRLTKLQVSSGKVTTDMPFPLDASFTAFQFDGEKASTQLDAKLSTELLLDLKNQHYQLKGLDSLLTVTAAALDNNSLSLALKADISADLSKQLALLDNLHVNVATLDLSGDLAIKDFAAPQISGQLALAPFALNALLNQFGQPAIETSDPDVLKAISLSATLGGKANAIDVTRLQLKLDDTTFNGNAAYALSNGNIRLNLAGDRLNADRYLPPKTASDNAADSNNTASTDTQEPYSKEPVIPVEPLKGLNLDSTFKLAALTVNNMAISNVDLAVSAHDGLVKASKLNLDLYGGTVRNKVTLDVRKTPVTLHSVKKVSNIQIGDLLQAAAQLDKLSGTLSSQSDIRTRGRSVHAIVNSLTGTAAVQMKDGEIKGLDMAQTLCEGMNAVGSLGMNTTAVDRSTPFADLSASTTIKNGVINNPDMKAALDALRLNGKGTVDLPQRQLDYRVGLVIEENLFKKTCTIPGKLENVEWPVDCKGSFDTPPAKLCKPDLSVFEDIFKAKAKAKVKQKLDEKKDKFKDKLTEKLGDKLGGEDAAKQLLKGLFGQ